MKQNKQKVKCLVIYTTDCDGIISKLEDNESIKKLSVYSHNPIRFETNRARKEFEKKEKELEASIRKEVVENILDKFYEGDWVSGANALWTDENTTGYIRAKEEFEKFLKEQALSKGITLK